MSLDIEVIKWTWMLLEVDLIYIAVVFWMLFHKKPLWNGPRPQGALKMTKNFLISQQNEEL